jgi:hypothetical protein
MTVLLYLIVPVLVAAIVIGLRVWRQRRPSSIEASLREFRDGLDALDPKKSGHGREPHEREARETRPARDTRAARAERPNSKDRRR